MVELRVDGRVVASYVIDPELPAALSPRPYLHPIRTLAGTMISDAVPEDHRWHLGLALGVQDVNGTNLWGGRTYVRGQGYTWLDDHGTITHESFDLCAEDRLRQRLAWRDHTGAILLDEVRTIAAVGVDEASWKLKLAWELTARQRVTLGSPATNGRPEGAGYGGCFLRLAPGARHDVVAGLCHGEEQVNGSVEPVLTWTGDNYRLTCTGLGPGDRWFVRTGIYPGVCAAWAYDRVRVIEAGQRLTGRFHAVITDLR